MKKFYLVLLLIAVGCAACQPSARKIELNPSVHDLHFTELADRWDEAVPLGNAEVGALVWQRDSFLRFSLDRVDLWDLRPMFADEELEGAYHWIYEQWKANTYDNVHARFDSPYGTAPAPSKIPAGALEFNTAGWGAVDSVRLFVENAVCKVWWNDGKTLETFVHATRPYGWFRFDGSSDIEALIRTPAYQHSETTDDGISQAGREVFELGYEQGTITRTDNTITYVQQGWNDFEYVITVTWKSTKSGVEGVWTVESNYEKTIPDMKSQIGAELGTGYVAAQATHQAWWDEFWGKSSIRVPDPVLEKQWYLEQYKYGSTARAHTPPISLQAVWTADNGKLPPWKGDFHHDLNTQLSYWPAYSGNHLEEEAGFTNWLWKHREVFRKYTKLYFGVDGINVPGVSTLDGEQMGGWIQYSGSPTIGAWLAQHFYLRWRYTMDREFLRERAYPWLSESARFLEQLSYLNRDGIRQLPLSSSPEINNNYRDAWFPTMTNYDLGLVKFVFGKAEELALELGLSDEAAHWREINSQWGDYAVDKDGLMFVATLPYNQSHRHFSHLMAFHPLGLLDISDGPETQALLETTVHTLERIGPEEWTGYSYSWMGSLAARIRNGEMAARYLRDFAECFCLKNSFHVNGDQSRSGKSRMTYRPFTLEGNMAFAAGLQEMLIQSHTGIIELLPAIPADWKELSFRQLRTEGAFLVSLELSGGEVQHVDIVSLSGEPLRLRSPFSTAITYNGSTYQPGEIIELDTTKDQKIKLVAR